ncbi:hypothetical protein GCM10009610_74030 [Pseudonocardia xinjiangensis]
MFPWMHTRSPRRPPNRPAAYAELWRRLEHLEARPPRGSPPRDDLNERIVAFMCNHPGMKLTAQNIGEDTHGLGTP